MAGDDERPLWAALHSNLRFNYMVGMGIREKPFVAERYLAGFSRQLEAANRCGSRSLLLLQRNFRPLLIGAFTFGAIYAAVILSALPASLGWTGELRGILASSAAFSISGSEVNDFINLQPLVGVFTDSVKATNIITYLLVASIFLAFIFKTRNLRAGDLAAEKFALVIPLSLLAVYHRYPDLFLLLGVIPFCLSLYREQRYLLLAAVSGIVAVLSIPLQTKIGLILEQTQRNRTPGEILRFVPLFRHQPFLLLTLALLVLFTTSGTSERLLRTSTSHFRRLMDRGYQRIALHERHLAFWPASHDLYRS